MSLERADFKGTFRDQSIDLYTLVNGNGIKASITNYGARLIELFAPDRDGNTENIIIGYQSMQKLLENEERYFGAVVGRCANRISGGSFTLNGRKYQLETNGDGYHLHGGSEGLHQVVWGANQIDDHILTLSYQSVDGEGGYPGNLGISVTYKLDDENKLYINYEAESDQKTILNMSHHAYYNLHGMRDGSSIYDHNLQINANYYTPVDDSIIPIGELATVEETPLDFGKKKMIGKDITSEHFCMKYTDGYDHNFVLDEFEKENVRHAARVEDEVSGRIVNIFTTQPGLQFYVCKSPIDGIHSAFCLEPQHFPDSPNNPTFPSVVLNAYESYDSKLILALDTLD